MTLTSDLKKASINSSGNIPLFDNETYISLSALKKICKNDIKKYHRSKTYEIWSVVDLLEAISLVENDPYRAGNKKGDGK